MKAIIFENYLEKFKNINKYLNIDIIDFEIVKFNNGEGKLYIKESAENEDIVIFLDFSAKSKYKYLNEYREYSKDEYYIELRRLLSALDNPRSVSVVLPNMYASRQNASNKKESKDYEIFINDLINLGVSNIISFECHGKDNRVKDISLSSLFSDKKYDVVVSPDKGGVARASEYAKVIKSELYNFEKRRDLNVIIDGSNPIESYGGEKYDFVSKNVLIVDDILDSGSTIINSLNCINGAKCVDVFIAYPLFNKGIKEFEKLNKEGKLNRIYISNLIHVNEEVLNSKIIEIVDCSRLISEVIKDVIK